MCTVGSAADSYIHSLTVYGVGTIRLGTSKSALHIHYTEKMKQFELYYIWGAFGAQESFHSSHSCWRQISYVCSV